MEANMVDDFVDIDLDLDDDFTFEEVNLNKNHDMESVEIEFPSDILPEDLQELECLVNETPIAPIIQFVDEEDIPQVSSCDSSSTSLSSALKCKICGRRYNRRSYLLKHELKCGKENIIKLKLAVTIINISYTVKFCTSYASDE